MDNMSKLFELVPAEFHGDFENLLHEREVSGKFWDWVKIDKKMRSAVIFVLGALADSCAQY